VYTIGSLSEAQWVHHSIRDVERIRDRNLVGILLALEENHWGAGETLARQRRGL
jgi:carnitine 3-dehydrogenase